MNKFFGLGRKKEERKPLSETVAEQEGRLDSLDKKIEKIDAELSKHKQKMATLPNGGGEKRMLMEKCMKLLRTKKVYEGQKETTANQKLSLEQTEHTIESVKTTQSIYREMKGSKKELKREMKGISIEKVEDLTASLSELMEETNEINEALGQAYEMPDIDEAELEAELQLLEEEGVFEEAPASKEEEGSERTGYSSLM
ncbi:MAG: charged multivesicular body protein 5 [Amphiamblys sp. WSBS2006]|nr:MAG: charged multivesicular body protein 5 [Amphiamblys sp. WSBS2006]